MSLFIPVGVTIVVVVKLSMLVGAVKDVVSSVAVFVGVTLGFVVELSMLAGSVKDTVSSFSVLIGVTILAIAATLVIASVTTRKLAACAFCDAPSSVIKSVSGVRSLEWITSCRPGDWLGLYMDFIS